MKKEIKSDGKLDKNGHVMHIFVPFYRFTWWRLGIMNLINSRFHE